MRRIRIPLLILLVLSVSAVMTRGAGAASQGDSTGMDWGRIPEYRIVPGDQLVLNFGLPEAEKGDLEKSLRVRPDGRISVYPIGDVVAAGRTPRELEVALVDLLSAELRNPRVTVEVAEIAGNKVHVLGRVLNPGSVDAGPFMTVSQAVTAAGGFSDDAARNSVIVFHRDGARDVRVQKIRLHDALKRGSLEADALVSRFDIVYVPRSSIGNVNMFSRQFFAEQLAVLQFAFLGWELFNLDRVFVLPSSRP